MMSIFVRSLIEFSNSCQKALNTLSLPVKIKSSGGGGDRHCPEARTLLDTRVCLGNHEWPHSCLMLVPVFTGFLCNSKASGRPPELRCLVSLVTKPGFFFGFWFFLFVFSFSEASVLVKPTYILYR